MQIVTGAFTRVYRCLIAFMNSAENSRKSLFRRRLFTEPMVDEVKLTEQARHIVQQRGLMLDRQSMIMLSREKGADLAAGCYYQSLLQSEHGCFINRIDAYDIANFSNRSEKPGDIHIVVVPGMFYKEYPDVGADGLLVTNIAQRFGFTVTRVATHSRGSISRNVKVLADALKSLDSKNIWLVSFSKGGSEVLAYLNSKRHAGLRGWINIAGINQGTPHASRKMSSFPRRLAYSVISRVMGVDYSLLFELDPAHPTWQANLDTDKLQCIHVVPIPLRSHVQGMLKKRYEKLLDYGPNDGIAPIVDVQQLPGWIYPIWGVDHFMRTPRVSELLYKIFTHVVHSTNISADEISIDTTTSDLIEKALQGVVP